MKSQLVIAIPLSLFSKVKDKLASFSKRFSAFAKISPSFIEWRESANHDNHWMVASFWTAHLQVHFDDKIDDTKVDAFVEAIGDTRIKISWSDDAVSELRGLGLEPIPQGVFP